MNKERLLRLADFLENDVPPERFDLSEWASDVDCQTAGCAVGWACQVPEFQQAGLRLVRIDDEAEIAEPVYKDNVGWAATRAFFGLTDKAASLLFSSVAYGLGAEPLDVAERIRHTLA